MYNSRLEVAYSSVRSSYVEIKEPFCILYIDVNNFYGRVTLYHFLPLKDIGILEEVAKKIAEEIAEETTWPTKDFLLILYWEHFGPKELSECQPELNFALKISNSNKIFGAELLPKRKLGNSLSGK